MRRMIEDSIPRDRHEIEQDIANVGVRIERVCGSLRSGETAEQIGDAPGGLSQAADDLKRLSGELAEVWPKPQAAT